ncbi:ester cyclase [Atopomonas sediminilitoris]|uniref:ester cyclase n=1 Tax=Atopomonas sediminilitoris TaxID=2919919 RepID=UPI001F4EA3FF|nr:ketosteroid isomerase-related protein [Atopomonas sediminilitoris]MCJ8169994.1 ester cyclase [Atopomonas sediminilitoris]
MDLEELKRLTRQHIDLSWNKGHLALIEQRHALNFQYKSSFVGHPLDTAGYQGLVNEIRDAMTDLQVEIEDIIAEGRTVVTWSTFIGTITKPALGYPASDKILSISAMAFWRYGPSGKLEELCTLFDMESFRAQLGLNTRPNAEIALP